MSDRAAAIILQGQHILLIHRIRQGVEYYVFPGGGVEPGESHAHACVREVKEETGLDAALCEPAFTLDNSGRSEHYFWVQTTPGELRLGGPEAERQSAQDFYQPLWLPLDQIESLNLHPRAARTLLLEKLRPIKRSNE